jgi:hypothetical protein
MVRNLPASAAAVALDPVVARGHSRPDLQEDLELDAISLGGELALAHMAAGLRIKRIEPDSVVDEWLGYPSNV